MAFQSVRRAVGKQDKNQRILGMSDAGTLMTLVGTGGEGKEISIWQAAASGRDLDWPNGARISPRSKFGRTKAR